MVDANTGSAVGCTLRSKARSRKWYRRVLGSRKPACLVDGVGFVICLHASVAGTENERGYDLRRDEAAQSRRMFVKLL
jgi:hypothetical protein